MPDALAGAMDKAQKDLDASGRGEDTGKDFAAGTRKGVDDESKKGGGPFRGLLASRSRRSGGKLQPEEAGQETGKDYGEGLSDSMRAAFAKASDGIDFDALSKKQVDALRRGFQKEYDRDNPVWLRKAWEKSGDGIDFDLLSKKQVTLFRRGVEKESKKGGGIVRVGRQRVREDRQAARRDAGRVQGLGDLRGVARCRRRAETGHFARRRADRRCRQPRYRRPRCRCGAGRHGDRRDPRLRRPETRVQDRNRTP